jgi:molybdopterin-guanine dinucleotide biosynthesis protein A
MPQIGGIVLCGGESKRMSRPKAWLPFGNEVMLQRVVRFLGDVVKPLVVVAAPGQDIPPLPADVLIARDAKGGRGPLQGLAAGLSSLEGQSETVYLSSCDAPFLQLGFVLHLFELLGGFSVCVPQIDGLYHPLAAVYRVDVLTTVNHLLATNRFRLIDLIEALPARIVVAKDLIEVDPTMQSLRNINTPQDYEVALRDAGFKPGETGDPDRGA